MNDNLYVSATAAGRQEAGRGDKALFFESTAKMRRRHESNMAYNSGVRPMMNSLKRQVNELVLGERKLMRNTRAKWNFDGTNNNNERSKAVAAPEV